MTQLPEWANWLARNKYGKLWAFEHHPTKMIEFWFVREGDFEIINEVDDRYAHIKWTDEEPTKIYGWIPKETTMDHDRITAATAHGYDELPEIEIATPHTNNNKDMVNEPNHYKGKHGIETIDVIRNFGNDDMIAGFYWGNAIKYMTRYRNKNGLEDLKKARKNLDWLIEHTEAIE